MRKISLKVVMFFVFPITVALLSGCSFWPRSNNSGFNEDNSVTMSTGYQDGAADLSTTVELRIIPLGYAPTDLPIVTDELNKLTLEDLNCTVSIEPMYPADYQRTYDFILSSGEEVDLLWASSWNRYRIYAKEGAFMALDEILQEVAPDYYHSIPQAVWEESKIDGKTYGLPQMNKDYNAKGFVYREDLRKKHDLPEIKDLASIEIYLECIKENEPDILPTDEGAELGVWYIYSFLNNLEDGFGPRHGAYGFAVKFDNPTKLFDEWQSPEFRRAAETVKRWHDKGFWSEGIVANVKNSAQSFVSGKCAAVFSQSDPGNVHDNIIQPVAMKHPEWEVGYLNFSYVSGAAIKRFPTFQSWVVPRSSKNPELALAFVQKAMLDRRYNQLLWMGIEGKNYKVDEHGHYVQFTNGYHKGSMDLNSIYNERFQVFPETHVFMRDMFGKLDPIAIEDFWSSFVEDYDSYSAERAAMSQVAEKYLVPIQAGIVPDVDEAIELLVAKGEEAGRDKIYASMVQQWKEYCEQQGIM